MTLSLASATRLFCFGLCALFAFSVAGCGGSGRQKVVPVTGKVTYGGGPWPKGGTIYFNPISPAPGFTSRPGSADFGPDGSFVVKSFEDTPGLAPATYTVHVESWEVPPSMEKPGTEKSYVPDDFKAGGAKAFKLEVKPGDSPHTLNYDIPKK